MAERIGRKEDGGGFRDGGLRVIYEGAQYGPPPALRRPHSAAPSEGSYRRHADRMASFRVMS